MITKQRNLTAQHIKEVEYVQCGKLTHADIKIAKRWPSIAETKHFTTAVITTWIQKAGQKKKGKKQLKQTKEIL